MLPAGAPEAVLRRVQVRIAPALEQLLAAALERDALQAEVVETAALRRSDVIKTALLRSVSHDLRSPLTAILTTAEALQSPALSEAERKELAEAVIDEAGRLSRLIDDLLDLSRLEADAAEPHPEWCSVDEVVRAAIEDLALPPETFKVAIDADLPPVRADAAQLERAFANLLENAYRHSGGHPVSVRGRDVGGRILLRFVDRGPGVPQAQRERIFEPFYRSGTAATGHRGSGLGLAIVRGFVEANGGKVWVESLPSQATSFVVESAARGDPAPDAASRDLDARRPDLNVSLTPRLLASLRMATIHAPSGESEPSRTAYPCRCPRAGAALRAAGEAHLWPGPYKPGDLSSEHGLKLVVGGAGPWVLDAEGRTWFDSLSGHVADQRRARPPRDRRRGARADVAAQLRARRHGQPGDDRARRPRRGPRA